MVKQNLSHTMFFVLGVLAISTVLKYRLSETMWEKNVREITQRKAEYQVFITETEVKDFMRLWPEFYQLGIKRGLSVSSRIENPDEMMNWRDRIWFVYHHLDPVRFFYVQQRIDYLLNALDVRRNAKALIEQLKRHEVASPSNVVKEMIDYQQRRYDAEEISENEQPLLETYEDDLRALRAEYPFGKTSSEASSES